MEQAVNTFNKGLQSDTHPMVQGSDTLSDALNATFVTMNGNEVILQNDMGNRRVDNAYLPAGYEPVGMKEYGGIIYVAAYNPITNRSQIGSFPSPERKISPDDVFNDLKGTLNFDNLSTTVNKKGINYLKTDTILVPLTTNHALHAGDKFVVYSSGLSSISSQITNYSNTSGNKIISPKNKKYTLALGILNSQNEFVDITKTLYRWNGTTIKEYTNNESDLFKFNDGYFIATGKPGGLDYTETIDDAKLIKEHQIMPANTYAYKLVGPLYLKATLNHIQDFNYNIYGVANKNSDGEITSADLYIEGFITYNCPDWISEKAGGDDNYVKYQIGDAIDGWFDFLTSTSESGSKSKNSVTPSIINKDKSVSYDVNSNLYTVKIVKCYKGVTPNSNKLLYYTIGVLPNKDFSNKYLEGLSSDGVIDFTKLGSGEVDLLGWRFFNTDSSTTLSYIFDAYPKYGCSFENLNFKFEEVGGDSNTFIIDNLNVYNGKVTINIDWAERNIIPRQLYKVTITGEQNGDQNITTEELTEAQKKFTFVRWFLSTRLMNECYTPSSPQFIKDYGNTSTEKEGTNLSEKEILDAKLKIGLQTNLNLSDNSTTEYALSPTTGSWIKKVTGTDTNINIEYEHKYNVNISIDPSVEAVDLDLYPSFITVNKNGNFTITTEMEEFDTSGISSILKLNDSSMQTYLTLSNFVNAGTLTVASNKRNISGVIKFYDKFKSKGNQSGSITNPFGKIQDYLKYSLFSKGTGETLNTKLTQYGGLGVDYDARSGHRDGHVVNLFWPNYQGGHEVEIEHHNAAAPPEADGMRLIYDKGDHKVVFKYTELKDDINNNFNNKFNNTVVFFYVFEKGEESNRMSNSENRTAYPTKLRYNARVWWRTTYGDWAMIDTPMTRTGNSNPDIMSFILQKIFKNRNIVYCFAETIECGAAGISRPDSNNLIYNPKYSLGSIIKIKTTSNSATINGLDNTIQCKNKTNTNLIKFSNPGSVPEEEAEIPITLISSEDFQDSVAIMSTEYDMTGLYLDTGSKVDGQGNSLVPTGFYLDDGTGKLTRTSLPNIKVTSEYGQDGYNTVLYNAQTFGKPSYRYDCTGWGHGDQWTLLDYNGINVVST